MVTDDEIAKCTVGKPTNLVAVGVRIPKVFYREGKRLGKQGGFSFSHFVRRALAREFLSQKEKS